VSVVKRAAPERLTTGNAAFDRILGGGIPVRSVSMIAGPPGVGKTLFALQMLFHLARQGKKCLYFTTLSEPALKLVNYMQQFSFFDQALIDRNIIFADLGSSIRGRRVDETLKEITRRVESEDPAVVVIDSFKAIHDIVDDDWATRTFVYDLAVQTAGWGAASLFVGEYTDEEIATRSEFTIADCIVRFSNRREDLSAVREVEILKLRGADYQTGVHSFQIGSDGLDFYPRVRNPDPVPAAVSPPDRVSTGVAGLDSMIGGGVPRSSTTVVQGGTGTGKTLLGLQFLLDGARRGEPGIHFTMEETVEQLREITQALGWDLRSLEERGLLTLSYVSPVELSTDAFFHRAREQVERLRARRAVLDSLTSMALGIPSERRLKEFVYAFTKHFRAARVTLNMNLEVSELLGSTQLSGFGISFIADNVIQLRYVEVEGRLERGISVLKARGVRHATDARRMRFTPAGIEVGAAFDGLRVVLTGLPVRSAAKEQ